MGTALVVYRKNRIRLKLQQSNTICEVLRRLYIAAVERNDLYSQNLLMEAYDMGKRMDAKLRAYKWDKPDLARQLANADRLYGDIKRDIALEEK